MEGMTHFTIADLLDKLSIEHIKTKVKNAPTNWIADIESDLDSLLSNSDFVEVSRMMIILALVNSKCWKLKDEMDIAKPEEYRRKLELSHDLNNGLKNSLKNIILKRFGELSPSTQKTTFYDSTKWYVELIEGLQI